ncbi:8262_t:CDS:2 [Ambispora gerdemannii]|uniref:8262_t:CDS:1 n=1 Tax=Ambispora gerdemannii TaxID=144530 RepID=A0A9N9FZ55_9GLOM|nr:8262_t:CDS:2 [Ambispora gerdemannii]
MKSQTTTGGKTSNPSEMVDAEESNLERNLAKNLNLEDKDASEGS